jgi:putative ABC transport system permease protein
VTPILFRAAARYHLHHPWQLALALVGVTLGVAVVIAVDMATSSARRAFSLSTDAVSGSATHEILGGPAGVPDSLYTRLRVGAGLDSIAPVVDRYVRLPDHGDATLRLLGIDPLADAPFRGYVGPGTRDQRDEPRRTPGIDLGRIMTSRALLLEAGTAARLGIAAGDTVRVTAGGHARAALLAGVLEPEDALARRALTDIAVADIATAQELAGAAGTLDRIELLLPAGSEGDARADELRALLPPGARLVETATRAGATVRMTRAFDTNLTALALVALVFGMFLIYNSVTFSIVQRRPLIGLLRAQGVTRGEVFRQVLAEAALLGAVATVLGLVAGALLGSGLVRLVARTINDLYFVVAVTSVEIRPFTLAKGALLGIGATVAAAVPPALEAVRTQPRATLGRSVLERRVRGRAARLAAAGALTGLLAVALLAVPSRSVTLGFAALFVLILAAALVTPAATIALMAVVHPVARRFGVVPAMAARGVSATLSRTAPAVAALSVAIAVGIAVTIMVASFRGGVIRWLGTSLQADVYVSAPNIGTGRTDAVLGRTLPERVAGLPGVAGVSTYRHVSLLLDDDIIRLIALDAHPVHGDAFELIDGGTAALAAFRRGGLLVSEPLAYRRALRAGDSIRVPTDRGPRFLPVAGVFRDYASEHGVIFIERAHYDVLWDDDRVTSLAVFLDDGTDADATLAAIRALPEAGGVTGRSNRGLREATLDVFDRTFVITRVLRLLALIVAFVGVTGALMALQLERAREIGVLRTTGLTPAQVWTLVTGQTGLMGFAAAVLAAPLGLAMAWAMVHVINRRSFGWSFDMLLAPAPFLQGLAVGVGAALLAGVYPAWRMARLRPADALRDE